MPGPRRRRPSRSLLGDATDLSRRTPRRSRAPWSAPSSSETSRRAPPAACAGRRPLAWLSARRRECLHRAHTEKRQIERAAGAFGLGLDFLIFALIDFGLGFRLDRDLAVAVRDGLAFDFHTLSHVFGQVLAGDERIPRTFITAVVADLRQEVVPVEALLQAPDHGHVLSALDLDLGLRRRLRLLRLRGQAALLNMQITNKSLFISKLLSKLAWCSPGFPFWNPTTGNAELAQSPGTIARAHLGVCSILHTSKPLLCGRFRGQRLPEMAHGAAGRRTTGVRRIARTGNPSL